jgi:hypothetical protein
MPDSYRELSDKAIEFWVSGKPLEAGRLIFERLPPDVRPHWAAGILKCVRGKSAPRCAAIEIVLEIAEHPKEWGSGHAAFSNVRRKTLKYERLRRISPEQRLLLSQLYLAENVAKVIYNATAPDDSFDEDSGWWVATCLKDFEDLVSDRDFSREARQVLLWGLSDLDQGV